ncbi:pentapeptide repeat-containing protein [Desulfovibrio gilichinskyi]|nr:pentapeptide repeat-containing protein [Desulfovibrio gilichinskyi]
MIKSNEFTKSFTCKLTALRIFEWFSISTFAVFILTLCFWEEIIKYTANLPQDTDSHLGLTLGAFSLSFVEAIVIVFFLWCGKKYLCKTAAVKQALFTDRINEALTRLRSEEIFVRISALSELWRIAKETKTEGEKIEILDTICAFIRDLSHTSPSATSLTHSPELKNNIEKNGTAIRNDIQIALKFVTRNLDELGLKSKYSLNLSSANLKQANLINADLTGANLLGTNLYDSKLQGAKLAEVFFSPDTFTGAWLTTKQCKKLGIKDHKWILEEK